MNNKREQLICTKLNVPLCTRLLCNLRLVHFVYTNVFYTSKSENYQWCENGRHTQQQAEDGPQSKWNVSSSEALDSSINKPDLQWKGQCPHCALTHNTPTHPNTHTHTHTHTELIVPLSSLSLGQLRTEAEV